MIAASPTSAPLSGSTAECAAPARSVPAASVGLAWKVTLAEGAASTSLDVAAGAGEPAVTSRGAGVPDRGRAPPEAGFAPCRRGRACPCFAVRVVRDAPSEAAVFRVCPVFFTIRSVLNVVCAVPPRGVAVLARSLVFNDDDFTD